MEPSPHKVRFYGTLIPNYHTFPIITGVGICENWFIRNYFVPFHSFLLDFFMESLCPCCIWTVWTSAVSMKYGSSPSTKQVFTSAAALTCPSCPACKSDSQPLSPWATLGIPSQAWGGSSTQMRFHAEEEEISGDCWYSDLSGSSGMSLSSYLELAPAYVCRKRGRDRQRRKQKQLCLEGERWRWSLKWD